MAENFSCCIFWTAIGCWLLILLVKICFFKNFCAKNSKRKKSKNIEVKFAKKSIFCNGSQAIPMQRPFFHQNIIPCKLGRLFANFPQYSKMLLIIYIAKPMLCHSPQCYHCLLSLLLGCPYESSIFFHSNEASNISKTKFGKKSNGSWWGWGKCGLSSHYMSAAPAQLHGKRNLFSSVWIRFSSLDNSFRLLRKLNYGQNAFFYYPIRDGHLSSN